MSLKRPSALFSRLTKRCRSSVAGGSARKVARSLRYSAGQKRVFSSQDIAPLRDGDTARYPQCNWTKYFSNMEDVALTSHPTLPTFRLIDESGSPLREGYTPQLDQETLLELYRQMVLSSIFDNVFYDAQRQGRLSFYMTNFGEEASHFGSAAALKPEDYVFSQYRELGVFLWRGTPLEDLAHTNFSNMYGHGHGRQMPVHYGSGEFNIMTISSPLGTQLPQAAGAAYALKRKKEGICTICYFGDGAASEGDAHAAFNFSATRKCPIIWFCRNNAYAISTNTGDQYKGDGIASRGAGYDMAVIRVDGNDLLAVHEATAWGRNEAVTNNRPVLIEAMTYRGGHHSTSDDSTRYREPEEIQYWAKVDNPIVRCRKYLESRGLWNAEMDNQLRGACRERVINAFRAGEKAKKPNKAHLFTDVFATKPKHLQRQEAELEAHLAKWGHQYKLQDNSEEL